MFLFSPFNPQAPISFFDVTPIGRIINRFSSDVCTIDQDLPFILNIFLAQLYGALGTIVITCYGLPWFAVFLLPMAVVYYFIQVCNYVSKMCFNVYCHFQSNFDFDSSVHYAWDMFHRGRCRCESLMYVHSQITIFRVPPLLSSFVVPSK